MFIDFSNKIYTVINVDNLIGDFYFSKAHSHFQFLKMNIISKL